jgi:hypothetical protein
MPGTHVNVRPRAHTKIKRKVKVQEEKDCTANMVKCDEAKPVELTQAYVLNPKHCSPEELTEMGKWSEKTTGELTQADVCKLKPCSSPEEPTTSIRDFLFNLNPNPQK